MIYVSHFFNLGPKNKAAQHINTEPAYHHCTSLTLSLGQALFVFWERACPRLTQPHIDCHFDTTPE